MKTFALNSQSNIANIAKLQGQKQRIRTILRCGNGAVDWIVGRSFVLFNWSDM